MITSKELRQKYLDFFKSKGHTIIPSASLIPENDPTVLFTTAGMHPLVPYLLGEKHPSGTRLANVQKCIRTQDIDEVGDNRHDTFFEMLGNWSLGDYFKNEAIEWSWEFLTDKNYLGLDPKKLAVSVFEGDNDASFDEQAYDTWKRLGVLEERIAKLPKKNNWWGPAGQTGPCGPDTEMFFWKGTSEFPPAGSNPKTDEDNWLEIWNDVFMQYFKKTDGSFEPLAQMNVDTGMGLERTLVTLNGYSDVFEIDTFKPLIEKIEAITNKSYHQSFETDKSMRIIADHLRTATMIMGDDRGIAPSNVDQGYIVRRLIRRAVRHGRLLGIQDNFCSQIAKEVIKIFADVYPEVAKNKNFVLSEMEKEEKKFRNTLEEGLKIIEKEFEVLNAKDGQPIVFGEFGITSTNILMKKMSPQITGKWIFDLYQSHGFPFEMTIEEIKKLGNLEIDDFEKLQNEFKAEMKKHQELSRAGAEQKFKGGLADTSEQSTKYHTATHLLLAALRQVLGADIVQKGSNITPERLRFDFNWPEKLTAEQIKAVEDLVNQKITENISVEMQELPKEQAKDLVTVRSFDLSKYGNIVKVYKIADFSIEFCGGPHVLNTGVLGHFKITKEEASSAGVRRIKAVLE